MARRYIIEGPASAGNVFGYWRENLIPAGLWVIVENEELANGGRGPCTVDGLVYDSREAAERALGGKPSPEVRERAEELGIDLDARTAMEAFR